MAKKQHPPIPVNIIAGALGVGKTTVINHLLQRRKPAEKWAVLVNEYGLVGLDAAMLEESGKKSNVEIREVAGGCICCTAGFLFEVNLVFLLKARPDRLIIEPTGLAELGGILDTLARKGIREAVDLRSVICLVDPRNYQTDITRNEVREQIEAADVVLASRSDLASKAQLEEFEAWATQLFPPKRHIGHIQKGELDEELLDLVRDQFLVDPKPLEQNNRPEARHLLADDAHNHDHDHHDYHDHDHHHDHDHDDPQNMIDSVFQRRVHRSSVALSCGWLCEKIRVFDEQRLSSWLKACHAKKGSLRIKAVVHTDHGWKCYNFGEGAMTSQKTSYRRDSRIEFLFELQHAPDVELLSSELRKLLLDEPSPSEDP